MFELHRKYLLSKTNKIIIRIGIIIITAILLMSIKVDCSNDVRWLNRVAYSDNYLQNMIFTIKFIGLIFSCYIMGSAFSNLNDGYSALILRTRKDRIKYYIGKTISLCLVVCFVIIMILIIGTLILYIFGNWFYDYRLILKVGFRLITIILSYGVMSTIVTIVFKTSFAFIIPIIIFLSMDVLGDVIGDSSIYYYLITFFPNFEMSNFVVASLINLFLISIYVIIGALLYYKTSD